MQFTFSSIEGAYQRDLLAQPEALRDTVKGLFEPGAGAQLKELLARRRYTKAVLTGMGSSYHVLYPACFEMNRHGIRTLMVETSELVYSIPEVLDEETLLVVVSQSGRSVEVVKLLERANLPAVVAVTNTADSPLARGAAATVLTRAGEEFSVSCKTYVAAVVAMQWLSDVVCGKDLAQSRARLEQAAPAAASYLAGWQEHVRALAARLEGVRDVFLAGRGASLATAGTGGLILKESTHLHAEGMSSPGFRHGPMEMLSPSVFLMVFEGDGAAAALNRRLADDVARAGGNVALAAPSAEPGPFRLPEVAVEVRPVVEILAVQMLSLALGLVAGREPGRFELASKVTTIE
jgi:glucosamine--fructose-6-phosphate aminotransferase (isomerizing)